MKEGAEAYGWHHNGLRINIGNDGHGARLGLDLARCVSGGPARLVGECRLFRDDGRRLLGLSHSTGQTRLMSFLGGT